MRSLSIMKTVKGMVILLFIGILASCQKDLYDENSSRVPSADSYFGFELREDVALTVDYDTPGFQALIEVYDQDPLDETTKEKKEGLEPIYKAYTDIDGKLTARMYVPTEVKEAYLYTTRMGLPKCIKLQVEGNGFVYDATRVAATTRAEGLTSDAKLPFEVSISSGYKRSDNMYSIVAWNANGIPESKYMEKISTVGKETLGDITTRVSAFLDKQNGTNVGNKELIRDPNKLNISIPSGATGTKVSVTFVDDKGAFKNTLGYYYYPTGTPVTSENFLTYKKYIIFPNASNDYQGELKPGDTVKLLYFDENGNASEEFPGGYTIGWFLLSNGYNYINAPYIKEIEGLPYNYKPYKPQYRNTCFSNEVMMGSVDPRNFITVYDEASKLLILGVEDNMEPGKGDDYRDVLFFVSTTPNITAGDRPSITDPDVPEVTEEIETIYGTLAFEDRWPKGGDYDLNDVIVEYKRVITFNKDNHVTAIEESFTPVQKSNSAAIDNLFAYQVNNMGIVELPANCVIEAETGSIIITDNVKQSVNKTVTIKRTFEASANINKDDVKLDFNPYIITNADRKQGRIEVHLPKQKATSLANISQVNTADDAYYIKKDGSYPFAIDIPILNFIPAQEEKSIDSEKQYPSFRTWAESNGANATNWYGDYKGGE